MCFLIKRKYSLKNYIKCHRMAFESQNKKLLKNKINSSKALRTASKKYLKEKKLHAKHGLWIKNYL